MNLTQLHYFCMVVTQQSITSAAKALYISQPALTKTIKNLESELGSPLFEKKGRGIELTEAGKIFYDRVNKGLIQLDKGVEDFKNYIFNENSFKLHITTAPKYIGNIVGSFLKLNPNANIHCSNVIFADHEIPQNYDLIVCPKENIPIGFESIQLLKEEMVLLIPRSLQKLKGNVFELSDLCEYPFITDWNSSILRRYLLQTFKDKDISPNLKYQADSTDTYISMIQSEIGIAFVPKITFYHTFKDVLDPYVRVAYIKKQHFVRELCIAITPTKMKKNTMEFCSYAKGYSKLYESQE